MSEADIPSLPGAFKRLPHDLYREDPLWIPEDAAALDRLFSPEHGFFAHGRATVQVHDGEARVAGFFDPGFTIEGEPVAGFGYWEGVDRLAPHRALFDEVERWARAQGARRLYGPVDFSTHRRYRLRLNRFDDSPFPGEPYNPDYYPRLLEALGFQVVVEYATLATTRLYTSVIGELLLAKLPYLGRVPEGVEISRLTPEGWLERLDEVRAFVDTAFEENPGYFSLAESDFRALYGEVFAHRFCPFTSRIALDSAGRLAAFLLAFPDYGPLVRQGNPERIPVAELRYERDYPRLAAPCFLAKTAAVRADYRRRGLLSALATDAARASLDRYADGMICLMHKRNPSLRYGLAIASHARQYGLFGKDL